jgi:hypothetical protein
VTAELISVSNDPRVRGETHLNVPLTITELVPEGLGIVEVSFSFLFDANKRLADVVQVPLVHCILEAAPLAVLLRPLLELLLLALKLVEARLDELEEFRNLGTLGLGVGHDTEGLGAPLFVDFRTSHFLQERKTLMVFGIGQGSDLIPDRLERVRNEATYHATYATLGHDVVWVSSAETGTFEEVHNVGLADTLLVETVLVLLKADSATEDDFIFSGRETIV